MSSDGQQDQETIFAVIVVVLLLARAAADVERGVPLPAAASVCVCVPSLSDKIIKKKRGGQGRTGRHKACVCSDHIVGASLGTPTLYPLCGTKDTYLHPVKSFQKSCVVQGQPKSAGEQLPDRRV